MRQVLATAITYAGRPLKRALEWVLVGERREVSTAGTIHLDQLGLADPERSEYSPAPWTSLLRALRGRRIGPGDTFVDFGAGKGRIVYLAARFYRFGRVIGVELSPDLTRVARANIEAVRRRLRCEEVELVTCDAADYAIPPDMTYAFFFNPFRGAPFFRVVDNIVESLEAHPRPLVLIYIPPDRDFGALNECERYILDTGRFQLASRSSGLRHRSRITVYTSVA